MKKKIALWALTIVQAIPVPISLITILGSIISLANIGLVMEHSVLLALVSVEAMMLAGTYTLSYILSVVLTFSKGKISLVSFLPLFHLIATGIFFALWVLLEYLYY